MFSNMNGVQLSLMNATARREKHKQELRTEILDAAREIFVRDGYESFSMRRLAERVEYSPASIYLHFQNKEELFQCLVQESFAGLFKALKALKDDNAEDPVALLKSGLRTYVQFGLEHPNHYRFAFLLQRLVQRGPYKPHPTFTALRYMTERCAREKRLRAVDVETASQALWAAVHGITSLLIQRPTFPWVARNKLVDQVINSAVDSMMDRKASTGEGCP